MYQMKEDIRSAIDANLPAAVGKELQDRLAKVDSLERQLSEVRSELEYSRGEVKRLEANARTEKELDGRAAELDKRQAEVAKRELRVEIEQVKREAAEERSRLAERLVEKVFGNPRIVTSRSIQKNIPVDSGSYTQTVCDSEQVQVEEL